MASTQILKSRIRTVKSTRQITKAMQLVSASKMRRAQEATKASDPYTEAAKSLLAGLSAHVSVRRHPLFVHRDVRSRLLIVIAADKGLAGAYNSNVLKQLTKELKSDNDSNVRTTVITVGRKASQFVARIKNVNVIGAYENLPDKPDGSELRGIMDSVRDNFTNGDVDAVDVIFTDFVSSITQTAIINRVLPAGDSLGEVEQTGSDVTYEPSTEEVLDGIAYRLVEAQIFQALLDSRASEHSMRMVAMKNATDNATDLIDDLTLAMNKARQAAITQELAEISGGVEALND